MIKRYELSKITTEEIIRASAKDASADEAVKKIIDDVVRYGDKAVREYTEKFDGHAGALKVTDEEISAALNRCDSYFKDTLCMARLNIEKYHLKQVHRGYEIREGNKVLGQRVTPIKKVGLYVPGGTASYPSTVLMNSVPAVIAGVGEIVMTTPADKNGRVPDAILTAAYIGGVKSIFKIGGAQAIAALAYGTETVPKVDKIVGPGNVFVAAAKRAVFGQVDIDMIAGPSEILIIADGSARADYVAADMLSQAEHDKNASAILITVDETLADAVEKELYRQLDKLPRKEIALASIENNGKIIIAKDLDEAVNVANEIAPEHLELSVEEPFFLLSKVRNAGSIFLGSYAPEPLGDYFAGTNHTLPTGGTAKFSSPLSVDDFVKKSSYIYYDRESLGADAERIADFAEREGLHAHANAVRIRFTEEE